MPEDKEELKAQLQAYSEHQQEQVSVERVVLPGYDLDVRKGISLDGGMVHIREAARGQSVVCRGLRRTGQI